MDFISDNDTKMLPPKLALSGTSQNTSATLGVMKKATHYHHNNSFPLFRPVLLRLKDGILKIRITKSMQMKAQI
jgi:hypothetical protein